MKKIILVVSIGLFVLTSCQKVQDPGNTSAVKVANEWWVTLDSVGIPDYYGLDHRRILTYNTSSNDNTIWVDDDQETYGFKVKATVDYNNLTFASDPAAHNEYFIPGSSSFPETAKITDGKIFSKMGHSKTGNIVDSLHFKIEFSDSPGFIFEINGVERSKFAEDDY